MDEWHLACEIASSGATEEFHSRWHSAEVTLLLSMFSANKTFNKDINKNNFYMSSVSFQSGLCRLYKKYSWYLTRKVNYANWIVHSGCLREILNVFMQLPL